MYKKAAAKTKAQQLMETRNHNATTVAAESPVLLKSLAISLFTANNCRLVVR